MQLITRLEDALDLLISCIPREQEDMFHAVLSVSLCISLYVHIYIYMERDREVLFRALSSEGSHVFVDSCKHSTVLCSFIFPKQSLAVGVLTMFLRGLVCGAALVTLPASIFS